MNDRLLIGTSRESAVMKAGKSCFRKGKEKRGGDCGVERRLFGMGDSSFADLSGWKEGDSTTMGCAGWRGAFRFGKFRRQRIIPFSHGESPKGK